MCLVCVHAHVYTHVYIAHTCAVHGVFVVFAGMRHYSYDVLEITLFVESFGHIWQDCYSSTTMLNMKFLGMELDICVQGSSPTSEPYPLALSKVQLLPRKAQVLL